MGTLSQNKKIAISAVALFLVSFALMLFFLENSTENSQTNVLNIDGHADSSAMDVEANYKSYLKDPDAPLFVTNAEGEIKYSNVDFCNLLSVNCEDFVGSVFFDYINSKDLSTIVVDHTKLIQDGETAEGLGPYRMIRENEEILLLFSAYPILDKGGKVSEIVFSAKDLTEQVEELNEDMEKEERSWIERLYPEIEDLPGQHAIKMVTDKIGYVE